LIFSLLLSFVSRQKKVKSERTAAMGKEKVYGLLLVINFKIFLRS
jgi:hypothetical protein